jgi:hypothetical protein
MAGGGIGEAMLISAAVGGGTAIATGQDPLKGALMGGLAGGVGGALMGPASSAASGTAQGAVGPTVAGAATTAPTTAAISSAAPTMAAPGSTAFFQGANTAATAMPTGLDTLATSIPKAPAGAFTKELTSGAVNAAASPANQGIMGNLMDSYRNLSTPGKIGVGIGGSLLASSLLGAGQEDEDVFGSPTFKYDWRKFKPTNAYAEGGITALAAENMGTGLNNPYTSNQGPLDQQAIQVVPQQQDNAYTSAPAAGYLGQSVKMMASGGISDLGGYSDGGRLLKGPGDGMSDHIPASISGKQPARLADGEFVVPADVVSHLGNGSTDAGAKHLYKMMNKVRKARTGNSKQGKQINPAKYMVA